MRKITVIIALLLVVAVAMPAQTQSFPDVSEGHWAYEAVNELVAAGVIEGYPDGEFKGQQSMTRYEMAMIIARMLENINDDFEMMQDDIDALNYEIGALGEGLTADQADDVAAIVQSMFEEQTPEMPEGLTEEQSEQVVNLIRALTAEFRTELRMLDSDLGALRTWVEDDSEEIRGMIADLEEEMNRIVFYGSYAVNFEHKEILDADGDQYSFDDYDLDEWYVANADDFNTYLVSQGGSLTLDDGTVINSLDEYIDYVVGEIQNMSPGNVEGYYASDSDSDLAQFALVRDEATNYDLPIQDDTVTGYDPVSQFSQTFTLGMDVRTDYFTASINLDVVGSQDEVSLDEVGLEIENDFLLASYATNNPVSLNDFAVSSETLARGVDVEFKEWDMNVFFGEYDVGASKELDDIEYDEDESPEYFRSTQTVTALDDYLLGASKSLDLGDFTFDLGFAHQAPKFDLLGDDAHSVFTAMTGFDAGNIELGLEGAVSYPFDTADELGFALRGTAFTETDVADLTLNARYADVNFNDLHGNPDVFGTDGDKYEERIVNDKVGFFARADLKLLDVLETSYGEFGLLGEDWRAEAGASMYLPVVDNLLVSGSFQRLNEDATEGEITDTIEAGLAYSADPLSLSFDYTGVMFAEDPLRTDYNDNVYAMENTFNFGAGFAATDNLTLSGSYEMIQGLDNYVDATQNTITVGADFADYEVINNLTVGASASYEMITGEEYSFDDVTFYDLEKNTITLGADLAYEMGKATFTNNFEFINMTGSTVDDGNRYINTLALNYEIVESTDFNASFMQDMMRFSETAQAEEDWTAREVKAGIQFDF